MKKGYLSNYFKGIAAKKLSNVEANQDVSNQHEFNGVAQLKRLFGAEKQTVNAKFLYLPDEESYQILNDGFLTWYDAREKHPTRSEFRLYFPSNDVTNLSEANDLLIISKMEDDSYVVIIAPSGSTYESQLIWLFGISSDLEGFKTKLFENQEDKEIDFASKFILEELGIEVEDRDENWIDRLHTRFGENFPTTRIFSSFVRETIPDVNSLNDPDKAIMKWIEHEEMLFRTLERHIVSKQLEEGFDDVDNFISYSLSVQNRRKSRVGHALEHHVEFIFAEHGVKYTRGAVTENKAKPDFIFPGVNYYQNQNFKSICLSMLGVKSTCKDRWRQVLSEAKRIDKKHLFTLEPGISENQTNEMKANSLSLVLPSELHQSYTESQRKELMSLNDFILMLKEKESNCLSL